MGLPLCAKSDKFLGRKFGEAIIILPPYGRLISGQKSTNSTLFKFLGNDTPGTHLCYNEGSGILGSGFATS